MQYRPDEPEFTRPEYQSGAIQKARAEAIERAEHAFDDILEDVDKAFERFSKDLEEFKAGVSKLAPAEKTQKLEKLSGEMATWLEQRNQRWKALGSTLGMIVRKGVGAWVGST